MRQRRPCFCDPLCQFRAQNGFASGSRRAKVRLQQPRTTLEIYSEALVASRMTLEVCSVALEVCGVALEVCSVALVVSRVTLQVCGVALVAYRITLQVCGVTLVACNVAVVACSVTLQVCGVALVVCGVALVALVCHLLCSSRLSDLLAKALNLRLEALSPGVKAPSFPLGYPLLPTCRFQMVLTTFFFPFVTRCPKGPRVAGSSCFTIFAGGLFLGPQFRGHNGPEFSGQVLTTNCW